MLSQVKKLHLYQLKINWKFKTLGLGLPLPDIISQEDVEDTPNCYNLQTRLQSIKKYVI